MVRAFKRNISFSHTRHLFLCLTDVIVAPSYVEIWSEAKHDQKQTPEPAKVKPETPRWLPRRKPNKFSILFNDTLGTWSGEEIKIKNSSNHSVLNERPC